MMGMGMGVGFSAPPPWTPAALAPSLWLGAYEEARATKAAQPVLVDGDMEAAGTAAWSSVGGTLSKSTDTPYAGTRCMRVDTTAAVQGPYQAVSIVGNRYTLNGAVQCDGVVQMIVRTKLVTGWTPGAGTAWQVMPTQEYTADDANRPLFMSTNAATGYFRVDDLSLVNLSLTSYTPKIGAALTQATPTAMPWRGALGMMFDGDLLPWGGAADAKCMHTGDGGSLGWQYRPTTLKAENRIVATAATAVGNVGVTVSCTNANTIRVRVMNGGGAYDYDSGDVACAIAINTTYTMVLRVASGAGGVSLRVNGTEVISGALTAPSASDPTTGLMLGGDAVGAATNVTGYIGKGLLVPRALTVAECAQFEAYCVGATL